MTHWDRVGLRVGFRGEGAGEGRVRTGDVLEVEGEQAGRWDPI